MLTELDPMQHSDQPHKCVAATQSVGRGECSNFHLLWFIFCRGYHKIEHILRQRSNALWCQLLHVSMRLSFDAPDNFAGAAGVYVLYNDGENVRLLYTLFEQELEVSEVSKSDQEHFGVYTIGDSIMKADLDVMVYLPNLTISQTLHSIFNVTFLLRLLNYFGRS